MKVYDKDIRSLLIKKFLNTKSFINDPTTVLVHEMDVCLGTSRIDMAIINGKIHGYEIKSEQDTLERLPGQIESYNKIFDTMTIITCDNHIDKVDQIVPEWWGIYCAIKEKHGLSLKRERQAKINKKIDILSLVQLLWKDELIELLESNGMNKGIKSKSKFDLREIAIYNINKYKLKVFVRDKIKRRESWRSVPLQKLYDDWQQ